MATTHGHKNGQSRQIPVIDISGPLPEEKIAQQLVDAVTTYGFVYIKNEGKKIPLEALDRQFELSNRFFSSPAEEKASLKMENNRGYSGMHSETLNPKIQNRGDFKEAMNIGEFKDSKARQPLPPTLVDHEAEIDKFQKYCKDFMIDIVTLFAIGLKVDQEKGGRSWFADRHLGGETGCTLRYLHYPPIPSECDYNPEVDIRAGAHSDYGSITLLFQRPSQPGLEIIPPETRVEEMADDFGPKAAWTPVPVMPPGTENDPSPPILVNIGDLLSYWTNNLFKSTVHRVVFPKGGKEGGEDRYSIAYFGHPNGSVVLEPVPSKMVRALAGEIEEGAGLSKGITADEHLHSRLRATYLDLFKDENAKAEAAVM